MAVPLRPGDVIIFNPLEPHAISSRCEPDDEVFCVSVYLKSAVVGLNDNSIPLSPVEEELSRLYHTKNDCIETSMRGYSEDYVIM